MIKQPTHPATAASTAGPCPTIYQSSRTPLHWKLPSTIARPNHPPYRTVPYNATNIDHGVAGSNPAGGEILPEPKRRFIAQSLSCSPFHRHEMTEILLKGRKTLTHPSIHATNIDSFSCISFPGQ